MPRYFFHIHDREPLAVDHDGHDFADDAAARREAIRALVPIAAEEVPRDGDQLGLAIFVTDASGKPLLSAKIDFQVDAVAQPPPFAKN